MKKRTLLILGLIALGTAALLLSGCPITVTATTDPTTAPPAAPVVSQTCQPNQYLRGGRHVWRNGAWSWTAPQCVARAATWRAGCRWVRGHWARSGSRYVFRSGRLACPAARMQPVGPTAMPPTPPVVRITCAPTQYLRGGKHVWRGGRWVWVAPRCIARPGTWRTGCRWTRGSWIRVGNRMRYRAGRTFCPKVIPLRVVHPTWLPPKRAPKTYKRIRCARTMTYYPGRWFWNNMARKFTWRPGVCIKKRRGCRWYQGKWTFHAGRSYYTRPHWRCRGKRTYVTRTGGTWTPPAAYKPFIRRRACRRGTYRNVKNRCVRYKRRCPTGFMLRRGRCFKSYVAKRCGRGWTLRAGRCVRVGSRLPNCRPGFRRVGLRCVRALKACRAGFVRKGRRCVRAPRACRAGFVRKGRRCVRALRACRAGFVRKGRRCVRAVKACRAGFVRKGRRCVRVLKACRVGFVRKGRRCVRVRRPVKRCKVGWTLRGRKCIKVRRPLKRCKIGWTLRGNRCIKVRRPVGKRCKAGWTLRGRRCVKVRRPIKRCKTGWVLRAGRCVKTRRPPVRKKCRRGFKLKRGRCVRK